MRHPEVAHYSVIENEEIFYKYLTVISEFHGANPQARATNAHVTYEDEGWKKLFELEWLVDIYSDSFIEGMRVDTEKNTTPLPTAKYNLDLDSSLKVMNSYFQT